MIGEDVDRIIEDSRRFLDGLNRYSRDREIASRLPKAVSNALQNVGSYIANDLTVLINQDLPSKIKGNLVSEFVNQRIFERARDKTGKEPLRIAERLSNEISERLRGLKSEESSILFLESIYMIQKVREEKI